MHDIRWIRENPTLFDEALKKRGAKEQSCKLLVLDERRRAVLTALQDLQSRRNDVSKKIGQAKASGDEELAQTLIDEVAGLRDKVQKGEDDVRSLHRELEKLLARIANLPAEDVPVGVDEAYNIERKDHRFGKQRLFNFKPKQHFELGEAGRLMDFEAAAKLSGARFVVLRGAMARLERAIAQFMLNLQIGKNGYTEISPPLMVRDDVMTGTGQLPKFEEDLFAAYTMPNLHGMVGSVISASSTDLGAGGTVQGEVAGDRHWLIPTAEVPLTNLVRESILDQDQLPMRLVALTPCFRAEAGAAGRDTRGMIRQHQFSKVELVSIVTPDQSANEHERMLSCAEDVLKSLDLPFRVMTLSTGDMGFSATKTYDIEVWLPGQNAYREISSCSNCGAFQARRMNARYRPTSEKQVRHVHTLNGSGLAVGRTLVAVLENYQNADGSVVIPSALLPYMDNITKIDSIDAREGVAL